MEPTEFAAGPDVGCEDSRGVEDVSRAFGLSDWKEELPLTEMGKLWEKQGFREKAGARYCT